MKKQFLLIFAALLVLGCNSEIYHLYSPVKSDGVDFTKGRWLIGDINTNAGIKEALSDMAFQDFSIHLKNRLGEVRSERLLIAASVPLNPSKKELETLKKGTNYDYYINIKSKNQDSDLDNFEWTEHGYYRQDKAFAALAIQIYDLNQGKIIYSQTANGSIDKSLSITSKPTQKVILGCYKKVRDDLFGKSVLR